MKKSLLLFALPLVALAACNKNNLDEVTNQNKTASFTAVVNLEDGTKTTLDGFTMSWTGDETFYVNSLPTTYPTPGDGKTSYAISDLSATPFTNNLSGATAAFTSNSFAPGSFEDGVQYVVGSKRMSVSVVRANSDPGTTAVQQYYIQQKIDHNQTYNPSNSLGLANNVIPLYGYIRKTGGAGLEPSAVRMYTFGTIIKLTLTNNLGANKTIDHITVTSSVVGNAKGIAGTYFRYVNASLVQTNQLLSYYQEQNTITLNCGDVVLPNTESKVFSFVLAGDMPKSFVGTLTFNVYEDGNDTPISTFSITPSSVLASGKIYRKAYTMEVPMP